MDWLNQVKWDDQGLVPVIAQEKDTGDVVMFAWMNRQSLQETLACGYAVYWSRSRQRLWRKGEESGHLQKIRSIRTDCDGDVLLLQIEQIGGIACHTGRQSCFYRVYENAEWKTVDPVLKDPHAIYHAGHSHD